MQRIWQFLLDPRVLAVIGLAALAGLLLVGADAMRIGLVWAVAVLALLLLAWAGVWAWRRYKARQAAKALEQAMDADADKALKAAAKAGKQDEVAAVRERMAEAVKLIKSSRLGETSGSAALYELPWYAVIGNPAAGKSSAVVKSGLKFPFAESADNVIQGIGGTRHCDWYFTTEGILLDTAGRYAVHEEDRSEWLGFLSLLKKHRPKAPLNGVIMAVSVAELGGNKPEFAIDLARKLRQRVQELTEKLEVFAPVYVVFTKADLIAGFVDFFEDRDRGERDKVWGATLPYDTAGGVDAVAQFETHFEALYQGLKDASVARMSLHRGEQLPPGVLTFPLEFAALKPALRTFINTLFEENPYQFRPIFRGFYFTSAVQEGQSTSRASERVAEQFGLQLQPGTSAAVYSNSGFFLKELFSRVIFADRQLVQQYTSRNKLRLRYASFFGGVVLLGALLAAWTWSYMGNRELVAHVEADLIKAQQVQDKRVDLQSRLEALEILQDRLEQMQRYRQTRPWSIGMGLYQGQAIEDRLKEEYFNGLQVVMLQPAAQAIAAYLGEVNAHAADLRPLQFLPDPNAQPVAATGAANTPGVITENANGDPVTEAPAAGASPYAHASSTNVTEAYNALKAYLMLGERGRLEPGHMSDQLTRFWRTWLDNNRGNMPREQLIQKAERIMSFAMAQMADPAFPEQELNVSLLDQTRDNLRRVIKGMPARERVYAEIKARAATRFAPVTVARLVSDADRQVVAGGYAVSGAFTREAWDGYVKDAIKDAANTELQSTDWVLKTASSDDLTLEGSPEQIQKSLTQLYKAEYVREWQKFMQSVSVQDFASFDAAVVNMNRLGDPANSPLGVLLKSLYEQTSWDNPSLLDDRLGAGKRSFMEWFKQTILGGAPSQVAINVDMDLSKEKAKPMGPIGKEFAGVGRLMMPREGSEPMIRAYLASLAKIRSRFNQMKTQGDPGPASKQLMLQTLEGSGELAEALKLVDEQMLNGIGDSARNTLRPLLVRPLMQAYAVIVRPTEAELNRVWMAQVFEPYQRGLADKYPFDRGSRMEAAPSEIAKVFGTDGVIAKFVEQSLGALVLKRGDGVSSRTWADMGVRLRPEFVSGLGAWIAPLNGQGPGASAGNGAAAPEAQTVFQIMPLSAPGLTEYTVEIDGQVMRYRNGLANWAHFVWPGSGTPGVRITGNTVDGKQVEFFNEPGRFGLEKMINAAQRKRVDGQTHELRWAQGGASVGVQLRIISNASTPAPAVTANSNGNGNGPVGKPGALPSIIAGQDEGASTATNNTNNNKEGSAS
ncbi:MAG TPA: type VI secretion system membrane subunit TssM [Aquabacterium sp.]|uniref:type VI secretion system membrane subunit TssM n=1 Tax=Aquabacterium sp. TaxID=1872578 RepID=UPI002E31AEAA|nr:type VI secretion system membrane subunit TssM [Aquabacterium sp.]HEX5355900.1 type VI secretion system membrane subunit TssM [Aquabacterium sp.]